MSTKNVVPRASGEGGLGRIDKPWGSVYAENIPRIDRNVLNHQNATSHPEGIAGNAATCSAFKTPVTINNVLFDGSKSIEIPVVGKNNFTTQEITNLFNEVMSS